MRQGTFYDHYLRRRRADGSTSQRGPYPMYTFKQSGKTSGKQLRNAAEADLYRQQIEAFRCYQQLSVELVEVSQRQADLEAAGQQEGKKNSKR